MDTRRKIELLGEAAQYDVCLSSCIAGGRKRDPSSPLNRWIYPAVLPNGRTVPILKILLSNACRRGCYYCAHRMQRDFPRLGLSGVELARLFMDLVQAGLVHGLFLSSAVSSGVNQTMEEMIKAVDIIRGKFHFPGYIHLKVLPGAAFSYVERGAELADRISLNLEAPSPARLKQIAPQKDFSRDIITLMKWAKELIQKDTIRSRSQTTQFVVGASGEADREILTAADWLYREVDLYRAYFSAFQPVEDTPLENHWPTPLSREHRLYQVDFLFRHYGFSLSEIVFDPQGNLPLKHDPKMVWSLAHPENFPVEVNKADLKELLRVPGIGPKSAKRIVSERRQGRLSLLKDLAKMGVVTKKAARFILMNGRQPAEARQLEFPWLERETGFEPATIGLEGRHSTN